MSIAVTHRHVSMGDVDTVLAFYGRYFYWMDDGMHELLRVLGHPLREVLDGGFGMPVVDTRCVYERAVELGDAVRVETAVVAVGRTSFDIGHVMTVAGSRVARSRTTHVWMTRTPGQPLPVPAWLAGSLERPGKYEDV
jgi:acyl-CoA thioesterase FadM